METYLLYVLCGQPFHYSWTGTERGVVRKIPTWVGQKFSFCACFFQDSTFLGTVKHNCSPSISKSVLIGIMFLASAIPFGSLIWIIIFHSTKCDLLWLTKLGSFQTQHTEWGASVHLFPMAFVFLPQIAVCFNKHELNKKKLTKKNGIYANIKENRFWNQPVYLSDTPFRKDNNFFQTWVL